MAKRQPYLTFCGCYDVLDFLKIDIDNAPYCKHNKCSSKITMPVIKTAFDKSQNDHNAEMVKKIEWQRAEHVNAVNAFKAVYEKHKSRYQKISQKSGVPAELIAVLHYRESTSDYLAGTFGVYLHNGQPLGKPTTIVPVGKSFDDFDAAAIDALKSKQWAADTVGLDASTRDIVKMLCYAERYNGMGYYDYGLINPYLYSGTNIYTRGKYEADGVYNADLVDAQAGVYVLLKSIGVK